MGKAVVGAAVVCANGGVLITRRQMQNNRRWARMAEILRELEEKCASLIGKLRQAVDAMTVEMHAGLASGGGSKLKMILSYVDSVPTGRVRQRS